MNRGRPPIAPDVVALVLALRTSGMSFGTIARKLTIGETTARRICKRTGHGEARQNSSEPSGGSR